MEARALALDDRLLLEELGWVHDLACRLMGDTNDADDLVQEAWLKARSTPPERFASRSRLRAWLAAVTRRMARDTRRSRRRRALREERAARSEVHGTPGDVVERSAMLEAVLHGVRTLDEPYRSTVLLRYMDGYATAEVAAAMSVSEELVRKRLSRALARLRALLANEWGGALPACIEESLRTAPCSAPPQPRSRALGAGLWATLGLTILAAFVLRTLATSTIGGELRTAPENLPKVLDAHSSSRDSGAVLLEQRLESPSIAEHTPASTPSAENPEGTPDEAAPAHAGSAPVSEPAVRAVTQD